MIIQLVVLFILLTKISYVSFPVLDKGDNPDTSNFLILGLAIIFSVLGMILNNKKYGTYYDPNNRSEIWLWKYKWVILLCSLVILVIGMSALKN